MLIPKPHLLRRTKDIAWLLLKHGGPNLLGGALLTSLFGEEVPAAQQADAEDLVTDLEALGPTFVKLGQLLAGRADLLPGAYLKALSRLQDRVEPFAADEVRRIVREELGRGVERAFEHFALEPIAAASLGQVHRASLPDKRAVAVKVQRPGIRRQIADDLEALEEIAGLLDRHSKAMRSLGIADLAVEFRRALLEELDYRTEAANLRRLGAILAPFPLITTPAPIDDYVTSRVLTMEFVDGDRIDRLGEQRRAQIDGTRLADQLFRAYLRQILIEGFFHADPHPGNVLVTDDDRIALLDPGQVGRIPPNLQEPILRLLLAAAEGDGDLGARIALDISERGPACDERRFRREISDLVQRHYQKDVDNLQVGHLVIRIARTAAANDVRAPAALGVLGKALLQLDEIGRSLAPDFNPGRALRASLSGIVRQRLERELRPRALLSRIAELKEFAEALPQRINSLLDLVTQQQLRVEIDAFDEQRLLVTLQRVANRITAGLVLAALIVGAAMMTTVETAFTIFGYPGFAMLFFLAAAAGGFWLLWTIFWQDRGTKKKPKR